MPPTHPDRLQLRRSSDVTCSYVYLLCTGRFHTRWDDEGFIPHSHWRSRCLGDQLALHPPCSTPLQLQDSNISLHVKTSTVYLYTYTIFPGLFHMHLYVVLRSILRVFGYLWIVRFITWMLQVPRPMMPIVVMPQMVQPVPLRRPPPPTVVQQALIFCFNIFFYVNDLFKANDTVCLFDVPFPVSAIILDI